MRLYLILDSRLSLGMTVSNMSEFEEKEKNKIPTPESSSSLLKKSLDGLKQIRVQRTSFFSREESKKIRIPHLKQLADLPRTLKTWERIAIFALAGIILASIGLWLDIYYLKHSALRPASGGQYTEGIVGQPKYINSILAQTNDIDMDLSYLVFSGLMIYNQNGELKTDLAEKYEILEDKKTYVFTLKPNLVWQDNEPLTADDIIFTIHRVQDPEFKSPLRSSFAGVEMEKIDDRNLKFILKEPYAPFLSSLTFGILPMHIWETIPSGNAALSEYNLKPIGSGPWQFYKLKKDKEGNIEDYSLKANPGYSGSPAYFEKINFKFYNDSEGLMDALQARQIDGASYLAKESKATVEHNIVFNLYTFPLPHLYSIFFNPSRNPLFKNKYIREAIECATPKKKIVDEAESGAGEIIDSPLLLINQADLTKREFNPEKTKEILEKEGWTKGGDGVYAKDKTRLSFILTTTDWPEYIKTAEILKQTYKEAGIELITESYNATQVQQQYIRPRNFEALLYGEISVHQPDLYIFWHSSQIRDPGLNLASFENKEADKILEDLRITEDAEETQEKYKRLEQIVSAEVPVIPLYRPYYLYAVNKKIKGLESRNIVFPYERFANLRNWHINQKRQWIPK